MRQLLKIFAASICTACLSGTANAEQKVHEDGPSPYPTAAADWPGEGVVRVFEWMQPEPLQAISAPAL